jgi:hypothetical protein
MPTLNWIGKEAVVKDKRWEWIEEKLSRPPLPQS